jgi:hypothetical protein
VSFTTIYDGINTVSFTTIYDDINTVSFTTLLSENQRGDGVDTVSFNTLLSARMAQTGLDGMLERSFLRPLHTRLFLIIPPMALLPSLARSLSAGLSHVTPVHRPAGHPPFFKEMILVLLRKRKMIVVLWRIW